MSKLLTDWEPFVWSERHHSLKWGGRKDGKMGCVLCHQMLSIGESIRWVYCNSTPGQGTGNQFCHEGCAAPDKEQTMKMMQESYDKTRQAAKAWGVWGPDWA